MTDETKTVKASDLLSMDGNDGTEGEPQKDKKKEVDNTNENTEKESDSGEDEKIAINPENDRPNVNEMIDDETFGELNKKVEEQAEQFNEAAEEHMQEVEKQDNEQKEIEEFKRKKKQEKNAEENLLNLQNENKTSKVDTSSKERADLSKLEKLESMNKRSRRSVEFPLVNSGYMIRLYALNTWIQTKNFFSAFQKEFGYFEDIDKLEIIYDNAEFLFKDGKKVDFDTFLKITSPSDLNIIHALWALVNNDNDPVDIQIRCNECGEFNNVHETPKNVLKNSIPDDEKKKYINYDRTKGINQLQKDSAMGKQKTVKHEKDGAIYQINVAHPDLDKYMKVDNHMVQYIVYELKDHLPERLLNIKDVNKQLRYLYHNHKTNVDEIYTTYTDYLLFIDSFKIIDTQDDDVETIQISLNDDGVQVMNEAINMVPDKALDLAREASNSIGEEETNIKLKGEPFKCSECGKISENDNIPAQDILFFTIRKMIQKR